MYFNFYTKKYKKTTALLMMVILMVPHQFVFAQIATADPLTHALLGAGVVPTTTKASIESTLQTLKLYGLDNIAFALASFAGEKIAQKIINKNNGGASRDSDPDYVQN